MLDKIGHLKVEFLKLKTERGLPQFVANTLRKVKTPQEAYARMVKALRRSSRPPEIIKTMLEVKEQCKNCQIAKLCRDSALSWIFLLIGVVATISIRVVNLVLPFGAFWPKFLGI